MPCSSVGSATPPLRVVGQVVRRAVRRRGGPAPDGPLRRPCRPARHPDRHGEGLPPRVRRRSRPRRPGGGRRPRRRAPAAPWASWSAGCRPAGRVGRAGLGALLRQPRPATARCCGASSWTSAAPCRRPRATPSAAGSSSTWRSPARWSTGSCRRPPTPTGPTPQRCSASWTRRWWWPNPSGSG